ncbi:MAG: TatD family hydrolase [Myxococcales bacterium]|nr:TatD family hydrolase [Myxococcales bacterium]
MRLIDAMTHLRDARVVEQAPALLARAARAGVEALVEAGIDPARDAELRLPAAAGVALTVRYAVGLHPMHIDVAHHAAQIAALRAALRRGDDDVVAVGEIGLDRRAGAPPLALQRALLHEQLALCAEHELPPIIHCVQAIGPLLEVLRAAPPLRRGGVVHGLCASRASLDALVAHNLSFSVGGMATLARAKRCQLVAREAPAERLLLESDCPDHPPRGFDQPLSEPAALRVTAAAVAALRDTSAEAIATLTADNARRLFGL